MPFSSVLGASSVIKPGVCTSSTRPSVPYEGQLIYETDTDRVASWNGSAWVYTHSSGLVLVSSGTFSGVSSWTVDGVFTSSYRNYRIVIHNTQVTNASAQSTETRLRVGGVNSTVSYYNQRSGYNWTSGVINADVINNGAFWFIPRSNGSGSIDGESVTVFDLYAPAIAVRTFFSGLSVDGAYGASVGGYHGVETAYDGIQVGVNLAGSTMTGIYRIYGYRE